LAIQAFGLTKRFPKPRGFRAILRHPFDREGVTAVQDASMAVEQGELFGLLGPNGAGKTTLIKLLATLIVPTAGTARVNGYDLREESKIKASLGLVAGDERSFYWRLTGRQNLEFFAGLRGFSAQEATHSIEKVLELVGLTDRADERFQIYSTGMKQRLSIARGLLHDPPILFMDEPTKSLDPRATYRLHRLIKEDLVGRQGKTVLLTTHRLEEAQQLCDRVAIMDRGRIRACGTLAELKAMVQRRDKYTLRVVGFSEQAEANITALSAITLLSMIGDEEILLKFEVVGGEGLSEALDVLRREGCQILSMDRETTPLEEVFAHFTEGEQDG
jgi:ABC-2 type transport system ATP-binding protein